ncbi:CBS domain-containing protein [Gallaecimonas xiamenensis]|uniref:CBS domain-containing protein n=1 Tax=Gallaecimonas xiamenensis 3-C-1 TaxID=745411 RepID=K2J7Y2_9GAMM|nr:CBS domain-containing protein [Gallaecimonas xiamenensis]EKE71002.1 CBS domain-containing protein [Gallaecimonas xiamenensis 3-C-1]
MNNFSAIATVGMSDVERFVDAEYPAQLGLESPAAWITTDFARRAPLVIEHDVKVDDALYMMKKAHVKAKLVVDAQNRFLGIVSASDLQSHKVLMQATSKSIPRSEITVRDVMTDKAHLHGFAYQELENASIGDVLYTLQELGEQHVLLLDKSMQSLRGMISAADIARALHIPIDITQRAHSFAEVFHVLKSA